MIVNFKEMIIKARKEGYAIPHFNCNSLDWIEIVLKTAQKNNSPVIVAGVWPQIEWSVGDQKMFIPIIKSFIKRFNITVPVVAHLDHGKYEEVKEAISLEATTSVMFDGSSLPFKENIIKTKEIVKLAKEKNISVEAEVGAIGGSEAGKVTKAELANFDECVEMNNLGIDLLAAGIGNIHGEYPKEWKSLDFNHLEKINKIGIPITLHGGSGIPDNQIKKAIKLGVSKINVHTEVLLGMIDGIIESVNSGRLKSERHPRHLFDEAWKKMAKVVEDKIKLFGSANKA